MSLGITEEEKIWTAPHQNHKVEKAESLTKMISYGLSELDHLSIVINRENELKYDKVALNDACKILLVDNL